MSVTDLVRGLRPDEYPSSALTIKEQASAVVITDQATYEVACELGLGIKTLRDRAELHHRGGIKKSYDSWKENCAMLKRIDDPLAEAERVIKSRITTWDLEQQRIRDAEETRLMRESAELAEREVQQSALDAIDSGATEDEVDAIIVTAGVALMPVFLPPPVRVAGVSPPRANWSAVVDSKGQLIEAAAKGNVLAFAALEPNHILLNQQARSLKSLLNIPGVRAVNKPITAFGRS